MPNEALQPTSNPAIWTATQTISNEIVFADSLYQVPGINYTVAGNQVTFLTGYIPSSTATLRIVYSALPNGINPVTGTDFSTVADIISDSLKVLGVLAAGETPSSEDETDAFRALNRMMDAWANERLALFATTRDTYTLTAGKNPHTIGAGGDFNTTRPIRIDRASLVLASSSNAELPLGIASDQEWQITQGKTTTGTPVKLWPETKYPLINLWLNPVPVNADTLVLYTWQQLGRFASNSTALALPPGYEEAIVYNLALRLSPMFGEPLSQEAALIADESLSRLKRANTKPLYLGSDPALLRRGPFNVISGDRG